MNNFGKYFIPLHTKGTIHRMMRVVIYSILYLFGLGDNPIATRSMSDYQAIQSDWKKVGMDIQRAMQKYEQQEKRN